MMQPIQGTMPDAVASPLAALSLIVAPAILTNASSVLAMSTSNRLARVVDRARDLARQLESGTDAGEQDARRLHDLTIVEDRAVLLMRALRSFYLALGAFAAATLLSLIGAAVDAAVPNVPGVRVVEIVALCSGALAVTALVRGSALLLRETRLAVALMQERADRLRARRAGR